MLDCCGAADDVPNASKISFEFIFGCCGAAALAGGAPKASKISWELLDGFGGCDGAPPNGSKTFPDGCCGFFCAEPKPEIASNV